MCVHVGVCFFCVCEVVFIEFEHTTEHFGVAAGVHIPTDTLSVLSNPLIILTVLDSIVLHLKKRNTRYILPSEK